MTTDIKVERIEGIAATEDRRTHQAEWAADVHFLISTDLGPVRVIVPVTKAPTLDDALRAARGALVGWASEIAQAARSK